MFAASKTAAVASAANYIEDVFSTYLYQGNGSTQTITNGIDLSGKGGLVWIKGRSGATGHRLVDTVRGATKSLESNSTAASTTESTGLTAFSSTGFSLGADADYNTNTATYVSWAFRKQSKFFDIVTYSGTGVTKTVSHNLGSVPGCIIVKRTDNTQNWRVYHRSVGNTGALVLNATSGTSTNSTFWNNTTPTATEFTVGTEAGVNASGATYEAYIFAHDAGGFGASGTDNVISCGSYTGNGTTNNVINLGYEAQFVLIKAASGSTAASQNWCMYDAMQGMRTGTAIDDNVLYSNLSNAETAVTGDIAPHATGFVLEGNDARVNSSANTYIYIAIRRGPMRTPTSGTSVFNPTLSSAGTGTKITTNFPVDLQWWARTAGLSTSPRLFDRLRGVNTTTTASVGPYLKSSSTDAEVSDTSGTRYWDNTGFQIPGTNGTFSTIYWNFGRAPGFFDEVCYTGNGVGSTNISHNLSAIPQIIIIKRRNTTGNWVVYNATSGANNLMYLNTTAAVAATSNVINSATATNFNIGSDMEVNASGSTYVAYLFATLAGVSKVGSYTGNGSSQTINCGFTAGARFVLIKRTDSTGAWYVWDTARGMVAGNDPWIAVNTINAQTTTDDSVDTDNSGFIVNQVAATNVNVNAATYIFLAIA